MWFLQIIKEILTNGMLINALLGWFFAQFTKMIIYSIKQGRFSPQRMRGDGGMPSCHSATVVCLAMSAGLIYGFQSAWFAVTTILAIIVIHDATGVRAEAGRHARILNLFMRDPEHASIRQGLSETQVVKRDGEVKEFLGHTPQEAFVGGLIGFIVAIIFSLAVWPAIYGWLGM